MSWHQTPLARAALASIVETPPALADRLPPRSLGLRFEDDATPTYDGRDDRVRALAHLRAAWLLLNPFPSGVPGDAMARWVAGNPSVAAVIDAELRAGERVSPLSSRKAA